LKSATTGHEWKYRRRYHNRNLGKYWFPNDEEEKDRLDMLHHVFFLALNDRYFLAPIRPGQHYILDVGTGTGIWAMDIADLYPAARVKGLDISSIQPKFVPSNVRFVLDDVEQDWGEPSKYDFIYCRNLIGAIEDWPRLIRQMYESLRPGGWVELQGIINRPYSEDKTLRPNDPLVRLMDELRAVGKKSGRSMDPAPSFKDWVKSEGFIDTSESRFKLPVGTWPKDPRYKRIGAFMAESFYRGVGGLTALPYRDVLHWSREEVEVLNASVRRAVMCRNTHAIFDFVVVTGMKPMTGL